MSEDCGRWKRFRGAGNSANPVGTGVNCRLYRGSEHYQSFISNGNVLSFFTPVSVTT